MITEQEIINNLDIVSKKLDVLIQNRRNNKKFWENIKERIDSINTSIKMDKKIYGW